MSYNNIHSVVTKTFSTTNFFVHHFVISFKKGQLKMDEILM